MTISLPHWHLTLATLFHTFAGYSIFFDKTILNPMEIFVKQFANDSINAHYHIKLSDQSIEWIWATTSTSQTIGALVGCGSIKYFAEKFGRRNTVMIIKNIIIISSSLMQFLSPPLNSIELLIFGRLLGGVAYTQTFLIPVFLAECSPTEFRGLVSSAPSLGCSVWSLIGAFLPVIFAVDSTTWNYLFLTPALPSIIHLLATPLFPKSVKHLYITKEDKTLTRKSSTFYHGVYKEQELCDDMDHEAEISPTIKIATIKIVMAAKQFRRPAILCVVVALTLPIGGGNTIGHYSTGILLSAGISPSTAPLYNAVFVQIPIFVLSLLGVALVEKFGRRLFLLTGIALSALGMGVLGFSKLSAQLSASLPSIFTVSGLSLVVVGLTIGPYLISPILPGELVPQASRSLTLGISRFFGTVLALLFGLTFPPLNQAFGSYCLLPLAFCGLLAFMFLFKYLPETKGKTVYQIVKPWMPKRKIHNSVFTRRVGPAKRKSEKENDNKTWC